MELYENAGLYSTFTGCILDEFNNFSNDGTKTYGNLGSFSKPEKHTT